MATEKRKRLWVDAELQGAVICRVTYYWFGCLLFVTIPLVLIETFRDPSKVVYEHLGPLGSRYWPIYAALTSLLPFIVVDALRLTHRFAGPIYRLRRHLQLVGNGQEVEPICFRENDLWQEIADDINRVVELAEAGRAVEVGA
jgi:hypothetical protein